MNSIAQKVTVVGAVRDFETNEPLTDAVVLEDKLVNGDIIDSLGNFQLTLEGTSRTIKCSYIGYYELIIKNIPTNIDTVELPNLKMATNYSSHLIVEFGPDVKPDMKKFKAIKSRLVEDYRIELQGNTYRPELSERAIKFDLNKPTGND
ncbi:MAG: hypothetical protein RIC53_12285 [Cyclobacteriaceae bacterium]